MTICIAAICDNGSNLILSTDSMITNPGLSIQFEQPIRKMQSLSEKCFALTAGDALAHTELFNKVKDEIAKLKSPSVPEVVEKVKKCYQLIRKDKINEIILNPKGFRDFHDFYQTQRMMSQENMMMINHEIDEYRYGLEIIVAGESSKMAHIYGISDPGTSQCFDSIGFFAIGSGSPHAMNCLIARGFYSGTNWKEGLLIVYEAKKMAEKAPGVGRDFTDICIISPKNYKEPFEFPRDKITELHEIYEMWVRKEESWINKFDNLFQVKETKK
ncbi:MAG: hypothetical protein KAU01_03495 [Candidatus Cloacimonetes bacterium]|nr:hypothetical protein [Candidatus Cloacimonadota bacterium]